MPISLRSLLIVPFVLQVAGLTTLVGVLSFRSGQAAVANLAEQLMDQVADQVAQGLDTHFASTAAVVQANAALLRQGHLDPYDLEALQRHFVTQINLPLGPQTVAMANEAGDFIVVERLESDVVSIRKLDASEPGRLFYRYFGNSQGENLKLQDSRTDYNPHNDPPGKPWYAAARQNSQGLWTLAVTLAKGKDQPQLHSLHLRPFYNQQGEFQGVTGASNYLTQIGGLLRDLIVSQQGQAFLLDRDGLLVATSTAELPFDPTPQPQLADNVAVQRRRLAVVDSADPLTRAIAHQLPLDEIDRADRQQPEFTRLTWNRQRYWVKVTPLLGKLDWTLVVALPEAKFLGEIQANGRRTVVLCALALLGSIALGLWTSRKITQPIAALGQALQAYEPDQATIPRQPSPVQEVEALGQAFSKLAAHLQQSFQALQASEHKFIKLLEHLPIGVMVFDPQGKPILLNKQGSRLLGNICLEESLDALLAALPVYVAGTDTLYPSADLPLAQALEGMLASADDLEIVLHGQRRLLAVQAAPILDHNGQVLYAIQAFQDITAQRQAEALQRSYAADLEDQVREQTLALRASEARLREAQRIAQVGDWELEVATGQVTWSPELSRLLGYAPQETEARYPEMLTLLPPEDRERLAAAVERAIATGTPYALEHPVRCPDGVERWLLSRGEVQRDEQGRVVKLVGTGMDISERKQAEQQGRESEAKFSTVFHANPAPAWIATLAEGRCLYVNESFCHWAGCLEAQLVGFTCQELGLWDSDAEHRRYYQALEQQGRLVNFETVFHLPNGETRTVLLAARAHTLDGQACVIGVLNDITNRKQAEQQLQATNRELQHAATIDPLTQVANRRQLEAVLQREWRQSQRDRQPLALILLDIDHFKAYNDAYGHLQGDVCLRQVAAALRAGLHRPRDLVARYGGEEFCIVLPHTEAPGAIAVVQRLQQVLATLALPHPTTVFLTMSVGLAIACAEPSLTLQDVIAAADAALYRAKQTRNAYVVEVLPGEPCP